MDGAVEGKRTILDTGCRCGNGRVIMESGDEGYLYKPTFYFQCYLSYQRLEGTNMIIL